MTRRPAQQRQTWIAPVAAVGGLVAMGVLVWSWASKKKPKTGDTPGPKRRGAALQNSPDAVRTMLRDMSNDYVVHAVVCAPDNAPPPLGTDRLLLYSKAQGRAMLARALTPQCHVECVFVDEAGNVAWDSSDDIPAYLARLEQLAQVVDKLVVAVIPCAASSTTVSFASLERAFQQHSLSKFAHVEMHKVSPNDPWTSLTHHLAYLRSQVWT